MEVAEENEEGESNGSDEEYSWTDNGVEGDGTNDLDAADPEPPTLQEGTETPQYECTLTPVQDPPGTDTEGESLPKANDQESEDVDEGRVARRKRLAAREKVDVKEVVVRELQKKRAKEEHKYHSKKGVGRAGRMKGSKEKQDTRVKKSEWVI
jgi:RIO kinase 2